MNIANKIGNVELLPHQIESIELSDKKNFDLSSAGTGKTFSGLGAYLKSGCSKLLVVCLAPKVQDFAEDGAKMNVNITPLNKGTRKNKELLATSNQVAISFESSWRLTELTKWVNKDTYILIDESHKVSVAKSKVTKFMMNLCKRTTHVRLLTATPISNGKLENYYSQLFMLNVFRKPKKEFEQLFVIKQMRQMGSLRFMDIVGYQNEHLLQQMINEVSVSYERNKPYMPQDFYYKTKKPAMFNKLKKNRMYKTDSGELIELDNSSKLFNTLRQVSHGFLNGVQKPVSKEPFERLQAVLEEYSNERIVIFYNYNSEFYMISMLLDKLKRSYSIYNGNTKDLSNFKKHSDGVVLAQYKSASTGINSLKIASVCVFNSMPLSSTEYIQAKARIDRFGQERTPNFIHIIPDTPVEKKIFETVTNGKDFTNEDIENILK